MHLASVIPVRFFAGTRKQRAPRGDQVRGFFLAPNTGRTGRVSSTAPCPHDPQRRGHGVPIPRDCNDHGESDLLELDGKDLRREPIEVRKATLKSVLRNTERTPHTRRRGCLPACLQDGPRRHRLEARLHRWRIQNQARGAPRSPPTPERASTTLRELISRCLVLEHNEGPPHLPL
jgi:hypothetical protein